MKVFLIIFIIGSLAIAGYFFRDEIIKFFPQQTEKSEDKSSEDKESEVGEDKGSDDLEKLKRQVAAEFPLIEMSFAEYLGAKYRGTDQEKLAALVNDIASAPRSELFPREFLLKNAVVVKSADGSGSMELTPNRNVWVTAYRNGTVSIQANKSSSMAGVVPLDHIAMYEFLDEYYTQQVKSKNDIKLSRREEKIRQLTGPKVVTVKASPGTPANPSRGTQVSRELESIIGPRPEQNANNHVPIMVQSIQNKDVTEIKLEAIESWGQLRVVDHNGEKYWGASVFYETPSLFGMVDSEALALIRHNKVIDWIYPGSGEDVP